MARGDAKVRFEPLAHLRERGDARVRFESLAHLRERAGMRGCDSSPSHICACGEARRRGGAAEPSAFVPTQEGAALRADHAAREPVGEEDYQAMRLAVRLGSLLAFGVGAVIVFYTLRFSVSIRARETSLHRPRTTR